MADQVVGVQTLHDHNDTVGVLVVETREQRIGKPLVDRLAAWFGIGIGRFEWIVDNDEVAATARERAADRGGQPEPAACCCELSDGILTAIEPCLREQHAIPV